MAIYNKDNSNKGFFLFLYLHEYTQTTIKLQKKTYHEMKLVLKVAFSMFEIYEKK